MEEKLKIGDMVYLKSGSPEMTIQSINDNNYVTVNWFEKCYFTTSTGELKNYFSNPQEATFSIEQLIKV